jgi:hypothetical protein
MYLHSVLTKFRGTRGCAVVLGHCATSRKAAGSIPVRAIGIFHRHNPSGRNYGPGDDLSYNRNEYQGYILGGKGVRSVRLTNLYTDCLEILGASNSYIPKVPSRNA